MFQKKSFIYSGAIGVCQIHDITKLTENRGQSISYYVLKSVYQKTKVSYIPVENHQVLLRELISEEEAKGELERLKAENLLQSTDEKIIGEIAWVLKKKPEEILPKEDLEE